MVHTTGKRNSSQLTSLPTQHSDSWNPFAVVNTRIPIYPCTCIYTHQLVWYQPIRLCPSAWRSWVLGPDERKWRTDNVWKFPKGIPLRQVRKIELSKEENSHVHPIFGVFKLISFDSNLSTTIIIPVTAHKGMYDVYQLWEPSRPAIRRRLNQCHGVMITTFKSRLESLNVSVIELSGRHSRGSEFEFNMLKNHEEEENSA